MMEPQRTGQEPAPPAWGGPDETILVPLDGSREAALLLPVARLIARITRAAVHVLFLVDKPLDQRQLLAKLHLRRRDETAGLVVDQVASPAANAIVQRAGEKRAMLLVMSTRGRGDHRGVLLGPVAEEVLLKSSCPVLLVRPDQEKRVGGLKGLQHILLPLDGAPSTEVAVHPAVSLAEKSGAQLDILYVAEAQARMELEAGTLAAPRYVDQPQYEWPAWAQEFVERFCACVGECPPRSRLFVRPGDPQTEILAFTKEHPADLIVLEWHGSLEPSHASVVRAVIAGSPCPVMLLRTRGSLSL